MFRTFSASLRSRILLLVLLAGPPAFGATIHVGLERRHRVGHP